MIVNEALCLRAPSPPPDMSAKQRAEEEIHRCLPPPLFPPPILRAEKTRISKTFSKTPASLLPSPPKTSRSEPWEILDQLIQRPFLPPFASRAYAEKPPFLDHFSLPPPPSTGQKRAAHDSTRCVTLPPPPLFSRLSSCVVKCKGATQNPPPPPSPSPVRSNHISY